MNKATDTTAPEVDPEAAERARAAAETQGSDAADADSWTAELASAVIDVAADASTAFDDFVEELANLFD